MDFDTRLEEILLNWEDVRRRGQTASVEELCRDFPELHETVRREIQVLEAMDNALGAAPPLHDKAPAKEASDPPPDDWCRHGSEPIPGYRLQEKLGKGGFGEVWKAAYAGGFSVALKFVPLAGNLPELRSIEIVKDIHHPNIVTCFGAWQKHGFLIIAMELAGGTLFDRFRDAVAQGASNGIPRDELLRYLQEAAKGIDYLNGGQAGAAIQHRDIKPQNMFLVGDGVKIGDLGLVRVVHDAVTSSSGSCTLSYAPPEFFRGQVSRSYDQYSLAITYCQLRGGRLPFTGNLGEVMAGHLEKPPDLSMLPPVEQPIVGRALAKDPEKRWPTCAAFVERLHTMRPRPVGPDLVWRMLTPLLICACLVAVAYWTGVPWPSNRDVDDKHPADHAPSKPPDPLERPRMAFHRARLAASAESWDTAIAVLDRIDIDNIDDAELIEYIEFSKRCASTAKALGVDRNSNPDSPLDVVAKVKWVDLAATLAKKAIGNPSSVVDLIRDAREVQVGIPRYQELDSRLLRRYGAK